AAGAVFDLHGFSESIDALNGGGTVTNNLAMPATLTVGANGGSGTFAGTLQDGSGPLGGVLALTKIGNRTQTPSANSRYTGLTAINKGAIIIQSNTALGATTAGTAVAKGAALQLQGTALTTVNEPLTLNGSGLGGTGALRALSGTPTWAGRVTLNSDSV